MADDAIAISYEGVAGEIAAMSGIGTSPPGNGWIWGERCEFSGISAYAQNDTARTTMQAEIAVSFVTAVNTSTTGLLRAGLTGTFDKSAAIAFLRLTADGAWEEYLRIECKNCGILDYWMTGSEDRPQLQINLLIGEFTITSWAMEGSSRGTAARVTIANEV